MTHLAAWVTLAIVAVYFWTWLNAARARAKYGVKAPSMDGPLPFLCAQRVQANTLEQLPLVLPLMWLCASFLGERWAAAGGVLWCVGRVHYALAYYSDPSKRGPGFVTGMVGIGLLGVCSVVGLVMN